MSLTDHLRPRDSPVRSFIEFSFPLLEQASGNSRQAKFVKTLLGIADLSTLPILVPSGSRGTSGTVGTAFDYWVRSVLLPLDVSSTVAAKGALTAEVFPGAGLLSEAAGELLCDVEDFLTRVRPYECSPTPHDEEQLARYCVVLAWLEALARAPLQVLSGSLGPVLTGVHRSAQLLDAVYTDIVEELLAVVRASDSVLTSWREDILGGNRYVANPKFPGSAAVGGADADLLVGGHLIELKTSSVLTPAEIRKALLQLAGYSLLDFEDDLAIRTLTVFYPRFGYIDSWPITSLIRPPGDNLLAWVQEDSSPTQEAVLFQLSILRAGMARICDDLIDQASKPVWTQEPVPLVELDIHPLDPDDENRRKLARHAATPPEVLEVLCRDSDFLVRVAVARHPSTPDSCLPPLASDPDYRLRKLVAVRQSVPTDLLEHLANDSDEEVRWTVAKNPECPLDTLHRLALDESSIVRTIASETIDSLAAQAEGRAPAESVD